MTSGVVFSSTMTNFKTYPQWWLYHRSRLCAEGKNSLKIAGFSAVLNVYNKKEPGSKMPSNR